jgi:hypothetical protein
MLMFSGVYHILRALKLLLELFRQDIMKSKFFFWELYKMPLEEYEWAVNEMMKDNVFI